VLKAVLGAAVLLFVVVQFVPVNRTNPPAGSEVIAPAEVLSVLRRSCYDCHSNETIWPWYSRVAPASWLIAKDVREGREAVNYSTWERYDAEERAEKQAETWEDVEEGEMPLGTYTLLHPSARLSAEDREVLRNWGLQATGTARDQ
jgi:proteasome lid subunit RPN8/RPN11